MKVGMCGLCRRKSELHKSHAIPDAFFRRISRESNGKLIAMTNKDSIPSFLTSERCEEYLLCGECESVLNEELDSYGINVVFGRYGKAKRTVSGVSFSNMDRRKLRKFIVSILWRCSISSNPGYAGINLDEQLEERLRTFLLNQTTLPENLCCVSLCRWHDKTGALTLDRLRESILLPTAQLTNLGLQVFFAAAGFRFDVIFGNVPKRLRNKNGVLSGKSRIFLAPYTDYLSSPVGQIFLSELSRKFQEES